MPHELGDVVRAPEHVAGQACAAGRSSMTNPTTLATGWDLLGDGARGTEPVVREMMRGASGEIHVPAYSISAGGMPVVDLPEEAPDRGVRAVLAANRIHGLDGPAADTLLDLNRRYGRPMRAALPIPADGTCMPGYWLPTVGRDNRIRQHVAARHGREHGDRSPDPGRRLPEAGGCGRTGRPVRGAEMTGRDRRPGPREGAC